jgi:hypothetical protein
MTLDDFVNKYKGEFLDYDLLSPIARSWNWFVSFLETRVWMKGWVFSSGGNLKIRCPVVGMVSVLVVDKFFCLKRSLNLFLNNFSVSLSPPPWVVKRGFVLPNHLTPGRTKNVFSLFVALVICKCFATLITLKKATSGFIVTISVAKSSPLRWRGKELFSTLFTDIFHRTIIDPNALSFNP